VGHRFYRVIHPAIFIFYYFPVIAITGTLRPLRDQKSAGFLLESDNNKLRLWQKKRPIVFDFSNIFFYNAPLPIFCGKFWLIKITGKI
jgi:hypothetical protein